MQNSFRVIDNFCPTAHKARDSAISAGFGTLTPNGGDFGQRSYTNMCFMGDHASLVAALCRAMDCQVAPNSMFFRATTDAAEVGNIHSDRAQGAYSCVVYLSSHDDEYGTAFYRHRQTGLYAMPTIDEMCSNPSLGELRRDMQARGDESAWERNDFVRGAFNRALIFHAPLFHARIPRTGIGAKEGEARLVWVCHFHTPSTLEN